MECLYAIIGVGLLVLVILYISFSGNSDSSIKTCDVTKKPVCDNHGIPTCENGKWACPWVTSRWCYNQDLTLNHVNDQGLVLQTKDTMYGRQDDGSVNGCTCSSLNVCQNLQCKSSNSHFLDDYAANGENIYIPANGYSTYFNGDPCVGTQKYTDVTYRYVQQ